MPTLLTILFAIAVATPQPPLSPEPVTQAPGLPAPLLPADARWSSTHEPGWVPPALRPKPKPKPKPAASSRPSGGSSGNSGMGSNVEQWRPLVQSYFGGETDFALCVIRGESGGNPGAQNPRSSAAGLWQFLRSTWDDMVPREVTGGSYDSGAVLDPVAATRAAKWLRDAAGWGQWNAASRC